MHKPLILGLSASLRNARSRKGGTRSISDEINEITDRETLEAYLEEQANIHLDQFKEAGRADGEPFDVLYRNLQRLGGQRGLSNSEIALAAALWGAKENGAEITHIPLPDHFPANGEPKNLDQLKKALRDADGIVLSTPVYFGDRGSLAQLLIDMIRDDKALQEEISGKVYAGIAVGAKRNGGQETTLIYAMMDMLNVGLLGVGNDSNTTSQYGGTGHAGDIGTMPKDTYGLNTSIGTGRRIASVTSQLVSAKSASLGDTPKFDFWVLQDRDSEAVSLVSPFAEKLGEKAQVRFHDLVQHAIRPCIACDICPTHVGPDSEYRCIIRKRDDGMVSEHNALIDTDIVIPVVYSTRDRTNLKSVYQQFMERTRYLRRGDYVFTDRLVVPLVIAEIGANEIMDIRLMTSFVRHHTVIGKPIVAYIHNGTLLNPEDVQAGLERARLEGARLAAGRLASVSANLAATQYQPVGYVLATAKDKETATISDREAAVRDRLKRQSEESQSRLVLSGGQ